MTPPDSAEIRRTGLAVVAAVLVALSAWIAISTLEAHAYARVTGKHVSTWDAMFLDLRVQDPVR